MSKYKFANNARAHLNEPSGITATQTSCTVDDSSVFPAIQPGEVAQLTFDDGVDMEIVQMLTNDTTNNTITMLREREGTLAKAWGNSTALSLRPTAEPFNQGIFNLDDNSVGAPVGNYALDLITYRYYNYEAASGSESIALGSRAKSAGTQSIAIGRLSSTESSSDYSVAIGSGSGIGAGAAYATALGAYSSTNGDYSSALGYGAYVDATGGIAIGGTVYSGASYAVAIGSADCRGSYAVAIGNNADADGHRGSSLGDGASADGDDSVSVGASSTAGGPGAIAIGHNASTTGNYSNIAIGEQSVSSGSSWSIVIGSGIATSSGSYAVAIGYASNAGADHAFVLGYQAQSLAGYGFAAGYRADAGGIGSTAIGRDSAATNTDSIAIGSYARTSIESTHNIVGLSIIKKDLGESGSPQHFCGQETVVMSEDISTLQLGNNKVSIALPSGGTFFPSKVGVIVLEATGVTTDPEVSFGNLTSPANLLAQTALAGMVTGKGYAYDTLVSDAQTHLSLSVQVAAVATSYRLRVYFKGFFIED